MALLSVGPSRPRWLRPGSTAPGRRAPISWPRPKPPHARTIASTSLSVLVPTGRQRSLWNRSLPCDALAPISLGFIIVILFIFSIKNKKSHIQQRVLCGSLSLASAAPLAASQAPLLPPWPRSQLRSLFFLRGEGYLCLGVLPCAFPHPISAVLSLFPLSLGQLKVGMGPRKHLRSGGSLSEEGTASLVPWLQLT